ncbi:D-alanyl-D-alanine carboxypeptidase/D-alanyl-D-alanine endopeptidase [Microlunatus parietis]|uniref:D-alanyl-D-alanine carboxypeptidase/D-alanyl-D-alanine-endopeptidase (Penicillin-binding protein 4) n=1 Tax=Microlunatus parietis TaxID=682979 RepID=A0A7Y9IA24_9ACTN|nr:D-alanyl-D-alanine carboxypeptidase/D-alanyl-D-alanine-endopeptidase [Microlunatus parietis]NYE73044.1 D-alanyl-D-alanine carboxypeptidase/D-alanyl-D-alanine-endopeptidase (penicillin-binding protein 4) [Microlunatus parietis]
MSRTDRRRRRPAIAGFGIGLALLGLGSACSPFPQVSATDQTPPPASTAPPTPTPTVAAEPAAAPAPVLKPVGKGPVPDPDRVKRAIERVGSPKAELGAVVEEVFTGKTLYDRNGDDPVLPASTVKLLTSAAALAALGPDHEFSTKVVAGAKGQVILVGGGDPYLTDTTVPDSYPARGSLDVLAAQTARQLRKSGQTTIRLGYDESLFTGRAWNATWPGNYRDQVTPTSALWVNEGRHQGAPRDTDPAKAAAAAFAKALKQQKISVTKITEQKAAAKAKPLASVSSMPLERIVEQVLLTSDNDGAEVLFRHLAVAADRPGSIDEAQQQLEESLTELKAWDKESEVYDGSGLSRQNRVPAEVLVAVLRAAASDDHPELRAVLTGLPVAGAEGTLRSRFTDPAAEDGIGVVRGKTGTLTGVSSLAGIVRTEDGALLAYAFVINEPKDPWLAREWVAKASTALARCGCA